MTGELSSRCGSESRPSRSHQHLLHPSKTDEIEVLESGALGGHGMGDNVENRRRGKVSMNSIHFYQICNFAARKQRLYTFTFKTIETK